ncbi:MAG: hypothetical protein RR510_17490, partial [Morganella sp. (in: enterobacteria)]
TGLSVKHDVILTGAKKSKVKHKVALLLVFEKALKKTDLFAASLFFYACEFYRSSPLKSNLVCSFLL